MDKPNTNKFEKPKKKSGKKNWEEAKKTAPEVASEKVNDVVDNKKEDAIKEDAKKQALEKLKAKVVAVNIDEIVEAEARKAADAYMTESARRLQAEPSTKKTKIGRVFESIGNNFNSKDAVKKTITRVWKHTFFDEYYRQREVSRVREEIKNSDNIYVGRGLDRTAHESAMQAISDRFISDYEGTLSEGEEKKVIDGNDLKGKIARENIKSLINEYAKGNIDDESFKNSKIRILDELNTEEGEKRNKKSFGSYADNLFEIAQNARLAVKHGAKMEELDYDLDFIVGKAKSSLKTEAHFNKVDKCIDKMKKSKVGRYISPAVLNTSIGIAYSLGILLTKKAAGMTSAVVPLLGSVIASSAIAGMNESQRLALERAQHGVEMAEGGEFEEGSKRREQFEKFGYQMESSSDLASTLRGLMFEKGQDGKDIPKDIKQEDLEKIFANLANIEARNSLNAKNKIDLISYSNLGNVEKERTDLTILVARAKVELRKRMEGDLKKGNLQGKTFDQYLKEQTDAIEDSLLGGEKGITAQDKAFKTFKKKEVAKKVLQTAGFGFVIGAAAQELMAFGNDNVQGMVEGFFHHDPNAIIQTPLDHVKDWISGNPTHIGMAGAAETILSNGNHILLPSGTSIIENADGTFDILRGGTVISDNIHLNFVNGNLDHASLAKLGESGIIGNTVHHVVDGTKEVTSNAHDWMQNHPGETINIHHDPAGPYMDNDTPMVSDPANPGHLIGADGNEIRTHWGGINGTGVNENGDAVLNVSHMNSVDSFNKDISVDVPEEMKNGNLMAIIYLDDSIHGQGIPVPINANGDIIFDHNNPIMQEVFKPDANGQMVSHASVIEIVQKTGLDANGTQHVRAISAIVGEGLDKIKDVVPTHIDIPVTNFDIPVGVQPPLFIPIMSRRPLESLKKKKEQEKKNPDNDVKELPEDVIPVVPDVIPEVIIPSGIKAIEYKVSPEERKGMEDDVRMLNKKEIESRGITTLSRLDFKSEYGRRRYDELKHIPDGKPVIFNDEELRTIGGEIENFLKGDRKVEEVNIKPTGNIEEREAERDRSIGLLGPDGKPLKKKVEEAPVVEEKKVEEVPIVEEKKKEEKVENIEEVKIEKPEEAKAERVFDYKDFSKYGTEFESKDFTFKTLSTSKSLFGPRIIMVEGVNKKTGVKEFYSYKEKDLKKFLKSREIKINKVQDGI